MLVSKVLIPSCSHRSLESGNTAIWMSNRVPEDSELACKGIRSCARVDVQTRISRIHIRVVVLVSLDGRRAQLDESVRVIKQSSTDTVVHNPFIRRHGSVEDSSALQGYESILVSDA